MKYISYTFASLMTLAMMLIFINMGCWMQMASALPFMKVDPWISGGEVTDSIVGDNYSIRIHEAVYQGLFVEDRNGYIQLDVNGSYEGEIELGSSSFLLNADEEQLVLSDSGSGAAVDVKKCRTSGGWVVRVGI